ncbi:zf-HC2 domain-containing protein [Kocuria sp. CPCC 205263]|uniref:zf-HC2 domain-containing protein n=1 Tax=Kocuria sp. CPCC 205263 TaxID=3073555 RepID=UPI0034D6ECD1
MTRPAHARPNGPTGDPGALRDDVLLDAAHSGDADAFGVLRERYHGTALAVARSRTGSTEDAEGVAAAALGRIEQIVGEGGGPRAFLGAFVVWMVGREADGGTRPVALPDDPADPASLVRVFSGLPAEWQGFLWRTEVLGQSARRASAALGLGAVAAAGLHRDMVRGLRGLYGQAAADRAAGPDCAEFSAELPHFVRGTRGQRSRRDVKAHLDGCARCTAEYLSRQDVGTGLRTWTLPVLAGLPLWGTESLELANLIAAAGAGTGAAAGAGAGTSAAAAGADAPAGAAAVGAGASRSRPEDAPGTSPWSSRRTKVLLGAGALATAVVVAAVGVSGGGDPVPAADSLAAERAPRTAEDLEKPRADAPAAGEEQEDDESGAGVSAAERDGSPSGSDEAAAGQAPGDAPAGVSRDGAGPEAAALVADAGGGGDDVAGAGRSGDDAGVAAAGGAGGVQGPSADEGATLPRSGAERPASVPGGAPAPETGAPGAASSDGAGAARDASSGDAPTSAPPARRADAPATAPTPAREAGIPAPVPSVLIPRPAVDASPAPFKAPAPPARTAGPPSDPTSSDAAPGRRHAQQGTGAPGVRYAERGPRHRGTSWDDDGSRERKHSGRHSREHQRGSDGAPGRSGGHADQGEGRSHR